MKKSILAALFTFMISGACTDINANDYMEKPLMKQEFKNLEMATFAGGCFWCMEASFEKLEGVAGVVSGYAGGDTINPTYGEVSSGSTGHMEVVQLTYDPSMISYNDLLDLFWRQIDPTDGDGSFVDRGPQYRSAIFYHNGEQKRLAETSKEELARSGKFDKPIATELLPYDKFYIAEDYHQNYYNKNPVRYRFYRSGSGRDRYIARVWGEKMNKENDFIKSSKEELRKRLTPLQYNVTQEEGTERPFNNEYWDNKSDGVYVDIVSGEPLFSSTDKYKSGTGWPSFVKPLEPDNIVEREETSLFTKRIEVRSKGAGSHLGHVFPDGPKSTGLRYCINSAALRFVPVEELEKEGLGRYLKLFSK